MFAARIRAKFGSNGKESHMTKAHSGWVTFAGVMLFIGGVLSIIYGIGAIADSSFFIHNQRYIFGDLNTWGWITLILGVLELGAAFSLFSGGMYGRVIAIFVASLSAIGALLSIPAYPFWSLAMFTIALIVIHQVARYGSAGAGVGELDEPAPETVAAARRSRREVAY
jgi:hypothetical protein